MKPADLAPATRPGLHDPDLGNLGLTMSRHLPLALAALVVATAALAAWLGVPMVSKVLGQDADFALGTLAAYDAALTAGDWWPRWLMDVNFGMGGTTFFTYPPLAFWAAAAVRHAFRLSLPDALALTVAFWRLAYLGTTYLWLRRHVPPGPALAGAGLAALAPYVLVFNPWLRFAYAETAATALLPLLLIAIERVAEQRRPADFACLALAWAALAMTHVATCVLAMHACLIYAWGYGGPRAALRAALGGIAGAGLAACFLLPAFGMRDASNVRWLGLDDVWRDGLMFFGLPEAGRNNDLPFRLLVWAVSGFTFAATLWLAWRSRAAWTWRSPGLPRASLAMLLVAFLLMTALAAPLWLVAPQLHLVAYPWRASAFLAPPLGAFAAIALRARLPARGLVWVALLSFLPFAVIGVQIRYGSQDRDRFLAAGPRLAWAESHHRANVHEHWPAAAVAAGWTVMADGDPAPRPRPALPPGAVREARGYALPEAGASFALPQFHFPAWTAWAAEGPLPVRARPDGFVEVLVDRPVHDVHVRVAVTGWEKAGWAVTALTMVILGAGLLGASLPETIRPRRQPAARDAGTGQPDLSLRR